MAEGSWSRFTAAEGGARLAAAARSRNTIAADLAAFTSTRLLHEEAHMIRGPFSSGKQRSALVTRASRVPCAAYELRILTDLAVASAAEHADVECWSDEVEAKEVIVCTSPVLRRLLEDGVLTMTRINVLVVDSCHLVHTDEDLQRIMELFKSSPSQPRVLGLTYPLFAAKRLDSEENSESGDDKEDSCAKQASPEDCSEEFGVSENVDDFEMYQKLEWNIRRLEEGLCCQMDLAEDMDGGKRFTGAVTKPKELIVEYSASRPVCPDYEALEGFMRSAAGDVTQFLEEHRYDPTEIYGEDLYEEFKNIPDPTVDPKLVFKQFLYVLDELGPYGADKAAFSLLTRLEKLKIKVPYERHFLLLCLCTTVLVKIRCYADQVFSKYSDLDKITTFSTPKVLRFIEILSQFENNDEAEVNKNVEKNVSGNPNVNDDKLVINDALPNGYVELNPNDKTTTKQMLEDIEKCDFIALSNKIEDKVNTYEANLKEIHDLDANETKIEVEEANCIHHLDANETKVEVKEANLKVHDLDVSNGSKKELEGANVKAQDLDTKEGKAEELKPDDEPRLLGFTRRPQRVRGRGRVPRNAARNQQALQNPDALCGIVFMNEPIMAKILFLIVVELSRSSPRLAGVSAQHVAGAGADPADLRRRARAREDALKKFRMHDCNLLLATSALEEGIDLPRCNLVLRWDVPPSYRSHGLCRGRARAPRAACALLARQGQAAELLHRVAIYRELDQIISRKCGCGIQDEPPQEEEDHADAFTALVLPYTPSELAGSQKDKVEEIVNILAEEDVVKENKNDANAIDDKNSNKAKINSEINYNINHEAQEDSEKDIVGVKTIQDVKKDAEVKRINKNTKQTSDRALQIEKAHLVKDRKDISEIAEDNKINQLNKNNELNVNKEDSCNDSKDVKTVESSDISESTRDNSVGNECNERTSDKECVSDKDVKKDDIASVDLSTAITLINRYCGKLPSDTFTRLAPSWRTERVCVGSGALEAWVCTLRLPLNCPVKYNIVNAHA